MTIQEKLDPDETLLWAARPDPRLTFLCALWLAIVLVGTSYLSRSPDPLWAIPVLAGLGFLLLWLPERRTFYGVTSRRAIAVRPLFGTKSVSLLDRLEEPIVIRRGFLGRVTFGKIRDTRATPNEVPNQRLAFSRVANAKAVCEQALSAQQRLLVNTPAAP